MSDMENREPALRSVGEEIANVLFISAFADEVEEDDCACEFQTNHKTLRSALRQTELTESVPGLLASYGVTMDELLQDLREACVKAVIDADKVLRAKIATTAEPFFLDEVTDDRDREIGYLIAMSFLGAGVGLSFDDSFKEYCSARGIEVEAAQKAILGPLYSSGTENLKMNAVYEAERLIAAKLESN